MQTESIGHSAHIVVTGLTKAIEYRGAYALALFQQIELQISKVFFQRLGAGLGDIASLLIIGGLDLRLGLLETPA